jgi:hypothetical protein
MWRDALHLVGRKHGSFLALSIVLLAWLWFRADTTNADLALGGCFVVALWFLVGVRAYMRRDDWRAAHRGNQDAR